MSLRKKKLCGECKAHTIFSHTANCALGCKVKTKCFDGCIPIDGIPQEVCPRPMTYSKYINYFLNGWRHLI